VTLEGQGGVALKNTHAARTSGGSGIV